MSGITLLDLISIVHKPTDTEINLANELKEKFWGEDVMPVELEPYVRKAVAQVIATGNEGVIYKDLELFLLGQKQSQNLLLGHCL